LNIIQRVLKKITPRAERYREDDFPSVVLLLREPDFPDPDSLFDLAQKAWGAGGPVEVVGTLRKKRSYMFSCQTNYGPLWFSIHTVGQPYGSDGREPLDVLQRPWDEHRAWLSIDSPHQSNKKLASENALRDIYKVLAIYAFLIWSPNVLAVFFPAEGTTIPNLGDLTASIQWGHRKGLDLRFLD
jgi:hypothetical protein